jgi:hypothetical protein
MKRREFITLIGGAVGVLMSATARATWAGEAHVTALG